MEKSCKIIDIMNILLSFDICFVIGIDENEGTMTNKKLKVAEKKVRDNPLTESKSDAMGGKGNASTLKRN